jgi:hypothetical protein
MYFLWPSFFRNSGHATVCMRIWFLLRFLNIVLEIFHSFPTNNERESVYIPNHDKKDIFLCKFFTIFFINKPRIGFWALSRYTVFHHHSDVKKGKIMLFHTWNANLALMCLFNGQLLIEVFVLFSVPLRGKLSYFFNCLKHAVLLVVILTNSVCCPHRTFVFPMTQ